MPEFTHLHVHSDYSFLDGGATVQGLAKFAAEQGMTSLALTDHGNMCGLLEFRKACEKANVRPILGSEIYVVPHDMHQKQATDGKEYAHLVLLAENETGYRNLTKIVSKAYTQGFYRKPRADYETLAAHSEGIVALTACLGGEVPQAIMREGGGGRSPECVVEKYIEIFGKQNLFLEVQNHADSPCGSLEQRVAGEMFALSQKTGVRCALTNDSHYLKRDDFHAHNVLLCINTKRLLSDENRMEYGPDFYLKHPEEMAMLFPGKPELMQVTMEIAERCSLPPAKSGKYHLPSFPCPDGMDEPTYLRQLCLEGLKKKYGDPLPEEVLSRFEFELGVLLRMGFASYFLITWDFVAWAKRNRIPVGPGRGSAAGSIISFALDITTVDPLAHGLLFERFLNPDRISMPDIDIDFCVDRRGEVIDYVRRQYGSDSVCQIGTFGKLLSRSVLKDVGRVLNVPLATVNAITKQIEVRQGKVPKIDVILTENHDLKQQYEAEPSIKNLWDTARRLEGLTRGTGVHAAGVVIAPSAVDNYVPLMLQKEGDDGIPVVATQFTMSEVEDQGLLKMDFLGLRNLTIIDNALRHIRDDMGTEIDLASMPMDDPAAYEMLSRGDGFGVFQLESEGMCKLLRSIRPSTFADISAVLAIYRPGPLGANVHVSFARRKHGEDPMVMPGEAGEKYLDLSGREIQRKTSIASPEAVALLKEILSDTYGLLIYQEQAMLIVRSLAGFTPGQADKLRKAIGKKLEEEMAKLKPMFIDGCEAQGHGRELGEHLWALMEGFGAYGFNKAHTVAYAVITYQTAWLKAHYPAQYGAALISSQIGNSDGIIGAVRGVRAMGVEVLPPDVNHSKASFSTRGNAVLFGLAGVKGSATRAVEEILAARERVKGKFLGFMHFLSSINHSEVNKATLEALIQCGAFDCFNLPRAGMFDALEKAMRSAARDAEDLLRGQSNLFGGGGGFGASKPEKEDEHARDLAVIGPVPEWPTGERQRREKAVIGFWLGASPLDAHAEKIAMYSTHSFSELGECGPRQPVVIGGMVQELKTRTVRKEGSRSFGRTMANFRIVGAEGSADVLAFADQYDQSRDQLAEDAVVMLRASVDGDSEPESPRLVLAELVPIEEVETRLKPTGNDPMSRLLPSFCSIPMQKLNTQAPDTDVVVTGVISDVNEFKSRKGQDILKFNLANRAGAVNVMVMRSLDKWKPRINLDDTVVVRGKVSPDAERGATIWLSDLQQFSKARRNMLSGVRVDFDASEVSREVLEQVKVVISRHSGTLPIYLNFKDPGGKWNEGEVLKLPLSLGVDPDPELVSSLESLAGRGAVDLVVAR